MSLIHHTDLERIAVRDLIPYAGNARTHSKAQIKQIAKSIDRFGFTNPVLIDAGNMIIAGHGRVLAAKALGHSERALPSLPRPRADLLVVNLRDKDRASFRIAAEHRCFRPLADGGVSDTLPREGTFLPQPC